SAPWHVVQPSATQTQTAQITTIKNRRTSTKYMFISKYSVTEEGVPRAHKLQSRPHKVRKTDKQGVPLAPPVLQSPYHLGINALRPEVACASIKSESRRGIVHTRLTKLNAPNPIRTTHAADGS